MKKKVVKTRFNINDHSQNPPKLCEEKIPQLTEKILQKIAHCQKNCVVDSFPYIKPLKPYLLDKIVNIGQKKFQKIL